MKRVTCPLLVCAWGAFFITATAQGQVQFAGEDWSPLGGAALSLTPDGALEASNLGPTLDDGFSIDVGQSSGATLSVTYQGRDRLRIVPTAQTTGRLGGLEMHQTPGGLELHGVVPQAAGTYVFELVVTQGGSTTTYPSVPGGGVLATLPYGPGETPSEAAVHARVGRNPQTGRTVQVLAYNEDLNGSAPGGLRTAVVTMSPTGGTDLGASFFDTIDVNIASTGGSPPIAQKVDDKFAQVRGFQVEITGAARRLGPVNGGVEFTLTDIGNSGLDGFTLWNCCDTDSDDDGYSNLLVDLANHANSGLGTPHYVHAPIQVVKVMDKSSPKLLEGAVKGKVKSGTLLQFKKTIEISGNNQLDLTTDFTELGGSLYQIDVYQNGVLVDTGLGDENDVVTLNGLPPGEPVIDTLTTEYGASSWSLTSIGHPSVQMPGSVTPRLIDGAAPVIVSFTALSPASSIDYIESIDFRYTGEGDVTILDIQAVPEPASAVLALLAAAALCWTRRK